MRLLRFLRRAPKNAPGPPAPPTADAAPWIGVDLDGTLAHHECWLGPAHIGPPVPVMVLRVRAWLAEGRRVKLFTARAGDPACAPAIRAWLERAGLPGDLEITATKDYAMIELWDDRAVQVLPNTGRPAPGCLSRLMPATAHPPESGPSPPSRRFPPPDIA